MRPDSDRGNTAKYGLFRGVFGTISLPGQTYGDMAKKTTRLAETLKEPVRLREKKLKSGNSSLYLDTYRGGVRKYEFLGLYLVPETSEAARIQNANTIQAANAIKSRRILDELNRKAGIRSSTDGGRVLLGALIEAYRERKARNRSASLIYQLDSLQKLLRTWKMDVIRLGDFDRAACLRFIDRLNATGFSQATRAMYQQNLSAIFNDAVRGGLIASNPLHTLESGEKIRKVSPEREFLTADEVQRLAAAPIVGKITLRDKWEDTKRAFLFACFTGLRVSDLSALKWRDIRQMDGYKEIRMKMQKTRQEVIVPLSSDALRWLPERTPRDTDQTPVFGTPFGDYSRQIIRAWVKAAGISKAVSWHTARHTFATLLLTRGADLYTVSKLLGHSSVTITQIYAKVIDSKKVDAINLLNGVISG